MSAIQQMPIAIMLKMKNKNGFILGFNIILGLVLGLLLVAGLIWFSFRIDNIVAGFGFLTPFFAFIGEWWWVMLIAIFLITPIGQKIVKFLLGKVGIKI